MNDMIEFCVTHITYATTGIGKGEATRRKAGRFARRPKRTDGKAARVTRRLIRADALPARGGVPPRERPRRQLAATR